MQYRLLGRTELRVSEIGCGGAPLGIPHYNEVWDSYAEDTTRSVIAALQRAVELGYNYFDTTPSYGEGRSEELMGEALAGQRHEVYLASKTEWKDQTRESILRRVEGSLRRLQTDYLDVLQFHGSDYTPDDVRFILEGGPMEAYQQLKQAGTIRFIGITAEEPVTLRPFLETGLFDAIQIRYNIIYQAAWHNILPEAKARNVGVVLMRPLSSGIFQKLIRAARPDIDQYLDLNALALNYVLSDPNVSTAIVGMRRVSEVEQNNAISDALEQRLDLDWLHERQVRQ
ncbi:MAG TPA: aldo/keto reductase [Roseiflexaceae bacterium]|nr:aldo/keto reductase [Roseiflexaceae bacterium]